MKAWQWVTIVVMMFVVMIGVGLLSFEAGEAQTTVAMEEALHEIDPGATIEFGDETGLDEMTINWWEPPDLYVHLGSWENIQVVLKDGIGYKVEPAIENGELRFWVIEEIPDESTY